MNLCQYFIEIVYECMMYVCCISDETYRYKKIEKLSQDDDDEVTVFLADSAKSPKSPGDFCFIDKDSLS